MCQSHRKQNVRVSNVTITQKQNVLFTSVIITQKTECTLPTLQSHTKQSVLVTRVIITQETECASYQRNNYTENLQLKAECTRHYRGNHRETEGNVRQP